MGIMHEKCKPQKFFFFYSADTAQKLTNLLEGRNNLVYIFESTIAVKLSESITNFQTNFQQNKDKVSALRWGLWLQQKQQLSCALGVKLGTILCYSKVT